MFQGYGNGRARRPFSLRYSPALEPVSAALLILQPAMGAGIASAKTQTPLLNCLTSLANHVAYGVGLYLAAPASAHVRTSW
jgi:hypothetical protein